MVPSASKGKLNLSLLQDSMEISFPCNVGNNTEGGVNQCYQAKYSLLKIQKIYATTVSQTHVYTQLCRSKPAYTMQTYNLLYLLDVDY